MFGAGITEIILILVVLGLNVLFFAAIIYIIVKLVRRPPKGAKKCPYCAEMIQPEAIVCRFCGRDLT